MYLKVWTAAMKYIKSQSDKGRIVDSKIVGQFMKQEGSLFLYMPSQELLENCKIRLSTNSENQPQQQIRQFELLQKRQFGSNIILNLRFGSLNFSKNGEAEFKTYTLDNNPNYGEDNQSQYSYKSRVTQSQARSQQQTIDNNLKNLQSMQYNGGNGGLTNGQKTSIVNSYAKKRNDSMAMSRKANDSLMRDKSPNQGHNNSNNNFQSPESKNHQYLQDFLNTQQKYFKSEYGKTEGIAKKDSKECLSQHSTSASKKNLGRQNNNQIIEQLYNLKKQNLDKDQIREKANHIHQTQINQMRNQIYSQGREALHSNNNKRVRNGNIDQLASAYSDGNNMKIGSPQNNSQNRANLSAMLPNPNDRFGEYKKQSIENRLGSSQNSNLNRTFFGQNYEQSPQQSQNQFQTQSQFFQSYKSQDPKLNLSLGQYSQHYPAFLRSNGPFQVYNHHKVKGDQYYDNNKRAKEEAKKRLKDQLEGIKQTRQQQKEVFHKQIVDQEEHFQIQQNMKRLNNVENLMYIQMQIESQKKKKELDQYERVQIYAKPHFGPEETEDIMLHHYSAKKNQQEQVKNSLLDQIKIQKEVKHIENQEEKQCDLKNLQLTQTIQVQEERRKRLMEAENKKKLRKAWIDQMNVKKTAKEYDNIFQ
ncbi:UNKNOWN [Stylonychia lemnae]|uniref:Uncharacterized protein n=1 Tax=Stylonychia lemnae TaxID=5949 RepID=A0A078BAU9_STYLE|nr:UNKNOWN [Stylonychia lemnae]|eukprot:CDW91690.1 UNKNOWN [Stylonychia lemnae]